MFNLAQSSPWPVSLCPLLILQNGVQKGLSELPSEPARLPRNAKGGKRKDLKIHMRINGFDFKNVITLKSNLKDMKIQHSGNTRSY